jgi:transcriptional regulator with XRE-family HTH domain
MVGTTETDVRVLFGRRLASVRKKIGWSQEQLSLESGVARSYLGGVERGQRNIAIVNVCKLAHSMGVRPYVLMDFSGEMD